MIVIRVTAVSDDTKDEKRKEKLFASIGRWVIPLLQVVQRQSLYSQ